MLGVPWGLSIANLSFNFNYNLVIAEISFTLQFSNHPPTAKVVITVISQLLLTKF